MPYLSRYHYHQRQEKHHCVLPPVSASISRFSLPSRSRSIPDCYGSRFGLVGYFKVVNTRHSFHCLNFLLYFIIPLYSIGLCSPPPPPPPRKKSGKISRAVFAQWKVSGCQIRQRRPLIVPGCRRCDRMCTDRLADCLCVCCHVVPRINI